MTREEFVKSIESKGFKQYKHDNQMNHVRLNGHGGTQWAFAGHKTASISEWSDWIIPQPNFDCIPYEAITEELVLSCTRLA